MFNTSFFHTINVHFRPQTDHCLLPYGLSATVLRLEEEHDWYPCLVNDLHLQGIVNSGWGAQECFLPLNGSCNLSTWVPRKQDGFSEKHSGSIFVDPIHGSGASSKLSKYYDGELAALVHKMYEEDFSHSFLLRQMCLAFVSTLVSCSRQVYSPSVFKSFPFNES
jgi:hypothetical protein